MGLTEEQKKKVLEQLKKFVDVHKEVEKFEEELEETKAKHQAVLEKLAQIRDEEQKMFDSFNLDEEGVAAYNKFVNDLIMKEIQIR